MQRKLSDTQLRWVVAFDLGSRPWVALCCFYLKLIMRAPFSWFPEAMEPGQDSVSCENAELGAGKCGFMTEFCTNWWPGQGTWPLWVSVFLSEKMRGLDEIISNRPKFCVSVIPLTLSQMGIKAIMGIMQTKGTLFSLSMIEVFQAKLVVEFSF